MSRTTPPRVAIVIGASSGIGRAAARLLAERGAHLTLVSRDSDRLADVARECSLAGAATATVVVADVLDAPAMHALVERTVADHGGIDLVVHAAAVMAYGTIEDLPPEVFARVVDVTVHGTANVARAVLPALRRQHRGTLVIVTSLLSSVPVPMIGAYGTAKWAQLGLARVLQLEVRDEPGVHVCTVAPGAVDTPIYHPDDLALEAPPAGTRFP